VHDEDGSVVVTITWPAEIDDPDIHP